jgi:hypothetical protein
MVAQRSPKLLEALLRPGFVPQAAVSPGVPAAR